MTLLKYCQKLVPIYMSILPVLLKNIKILRKVKFAKYKTFFTLLGVYRQQTFNSQFAFYTKQNPLFFCIARGLKEP